MGQGDAWNMSYTTRKRHPLFFRYPPYPPPSGLHLWPPAPPDREAPALSGLIAPRHKQEKAGAIAPAFRCHSCIWNRTSRTCAINTVAQPLNYAATSQYLTRWLLSSLVLLHLVINGPVDKCVHAFPSALCMGLYNVFLTFGERQVNPIVCFCNPVILRFS